MYKIWLFLYCQYYLQVMHKDNMNIIAEFHFYDTVLKVIAYCQNTPNITKEVEIMYVDEDNNNDTGSCSDGGSGYD